MFIGLISYSLYLWHWPILAFLRLYYGRLDLETETELLAIAISVVLAVLSWRFIENPFRKGKILSRTQLFATAATATAVLVVAAGSISHQVGYPSRFSEQVNRFANAANDIDRRALVCLGHFPAKEFCQFGSTASMHPSYLVWGDSHAGALLPAFDVAAQRAGTSGLFAGGPSCPPLIGVRVSDDSFGEECRKYNDEVLRTLELTEPSIERVFLAARWAFMANGTRAAGETGSRILLADEMQEAVGPGGNPAIFERGLRRTIEALLALDKSVILIESTPEIGWNVPMGFAAAEAWGHPLPAAPTAEQYTARNQPVVNALKNLHATVAFETWPIASVLCEIECKLLHNGQPIYRDGNHLSVYGATTLIAPGLVELIQPPQ